MSFSMLTQSPPFLEGQLSRRRSSGSSSFGNLPPRRDSRDLLAGFDVYSTPTIRKLYDLQAELDYQCLQLATKEDIRPTRYATSDVNSVVVIAVFLSGSLSLVRFPGTFLFQEVQLRALISCLALLHYHEVEALYPASWDKLSTNISDLFRQIAFQPRSELTLAEEVRYASNVYLVQLVSQYLSFIRRGDSKLPSVVGPIIKIFFGGIALVGHFHCMSRLEEFLVDRKIQVGHQYNNVQQILEGLTELSLLWQRPQSKYKALWGLQEYTRLAYSLSRESAFALKSGEVREATALIVSALLQKVDELVNSESSASSPRLRRNWNKTRTLMGMGPPDIDQGYYFLGLLDCAAQLATVGSPEMLPIDFAEKVRRLVFESIVPEFRWKAIEILLACRASRREQSQDLMIRLEAHCQISLQETVTREISVIVELLDNDERAELRVSYVEPVIRPSSHVDHIELGEKIDLLNRVTTSPVLVPEPSPESSIVSSHFQESALSKSRVKATRLFSISFARSGIFGTRTSYECAGLSDNCRYAFFYNENKVSVFHLPDLTVQFTEVILPRELGPGKDFIYEDPIFDVVMSQRYLVVITSQCMRIVNIRSAHELELVPHAEWEPTRVACYESETHLMIALGQGQGNSLESSKGRIVCYKYEIDSVSGKLSVCPILMLLSQDRPKRVSLDANGTIVTCVTTIQNKLLVWDLDEDPSALGKPFEFIKNFYSLERYETGITSTSIYISPSRNRYILATTSPSNERHRNHGEWSFSLPFPFFSTPTTPRLRPPCQTIHDFVQFQAHRTLRMGAVSERHNVFAVMESSGRISLLPLVNADQGGIRGGPEIRVLEEWKGTGGGCLRFVSGNGGERLVAIDTKGKGVIVDFGREYIGKSSTLCLT